MLWRKLFLLSILMAGCTGSVADGIGGESSGTPAQGVDQTPVVFEACSPGSLRACSCNPGFGEQRCVADGTGFVACGCGDMGAGGAPGGSGGGAGGPAGTGGSGAVGGSAADAGVMGQPDAGVMDTGPGVVVAEPADEASYIFDQSQLRTYDIQVAPADLAMIDQSPAAEQYVGASLSFEGQTISNIGMRYKGSVGAFVSPCTASSIGQTPGAKIGKCSIKLKFNYVDPDALFHGVKKLNFHSMNHDRSMMRDRLGYAMFREFGVPAPRAVHARVLINGQLEGLFVVVEQVDGRFARSRFSEGGKGNVYKEIWPIHDDASAYLNALVTNEDEMPSVQRMLDFKDAIGTDASSMAQWIDRDLTLKYIAADRVMINDDGAFHWWCAAGGQGNNPRPYGNHNYYWYEATHADRFWIIPWDMDNSLSGWDFVHIDTEWRDVGSCSCGFGGQQAPSCDTMISQWGQWDTDYESAVDAFLAGPFAVSNVNGKLDSWESQISGAVSEAAGVNSAPSAVQWQAELSDLKSRIGTMRQNRGYPY